MQFAMPPRGNAAYPSTYPRSSRASTYQRRRLRNLALLGAGILVGIYIIIKLFSGSSHEPAPVTKAPLGSAEVVIVTVFDKGMSEGYIKKIKENRDFYAKKHAYKNFYMKQEDYNVNDSPASWAMVPAMRHALTLNPHSTYFFYLSPHSMIMNPSVSIEADIMASNKLESILLKDKPVVPPDSVIHTFSHLKGHQIDFVLTQDEEGLCPESMVIRRGDWANFFFDTWFDPLYRSYNFQKAENHALEHIVQWHPTILTKLALIPQRFINSYAIDIPSRGTGARYAEGDFIARVPGCEKDHKRTCEEEITPFYNKWRQANIPY